MIKAIVNILHSAESLATALPSAPLSNEFSARIKGGNISALLSHVGYSGVKK
jgi:hypothetical protein